MYCYVAKQNFSRESKPKLRRQMLFHPLKTLGLFMCCTNNPSCTYCNVWNNSLSQDIFQRKTLLCQCMCIICTEIMSRQSSSKLQAYNPEFQTSLVHANVIMSWQCISHVSKVISHTGIVNIRCIRIILFFYLACTRSERRCHNNSRSLEGNTTSGFFQQWNWKLTTT